MWRGLFVAILLAGCVQMPPSAQDLQAKRFEAVPGKAVIYLVRNNPDISRVAATLKLDGVIMGTTYPGTYFRWEVAPGPHRIAGFGPDNGEITLATEAGKIYFVQQVVMTLFSPSSSFSVVSDPEGRMIAMRSELVRVQ